MSVCDVKMQINFGCKYLPGKCRLRKKKEKQWWGKRQDTHLEFWKKICYRLIRQCDCTEKDHNCMRWIITAGCQKHHPQSNFCIFLDFYTTLNVQNNLKDGTLKQQCLSSLEFHQLELQLHSRTMSCSKILSFYKGLNFFYKNLKICISCFVEYGFRLESMTSFMLSATDTFFL